MLDKFDFVGIPLRNRFLSGFLDKPSEEVKEILSCLTRIVSLPDAKRRALFNLVKEMVSNG